MHVPDQNSIRELLVTLGLCSNDSIKVFHPRVRDRGDVEVLRCSRSGVIFLGSSDHLDDDHYEGKGEFEYWKTAGRRESTLNLRDDDRRRHAQIEPLVRNRRWLDFGTGVGGLLDLLASDASEASAVEIQPGPREALLQDGYHIFADVDEADDNYDIVTAFHVIEHLPRPIETLSVLRGKLCDGGRIVLEVPHARDFLIDFLDLHSFKCFTFWSEHLILHTRQSLETFLREAGFTNVSITGVQRYPLANHLYWLSRNEPGGHTRWPFLRSDELDHAYANMLTNLDKTDTLLAIAER